MKAYGRDWVFSEPCRHLRGRIGRSGRGDAALGLRIDQQSLKRVSLGLNQRLVSTVLEKGGHACTGVAGIELEEYSGFANVPWSRILLIPCDFRLRTVNLMRTC